MGWQRPPTSRKEANAFRVRAYRRAADTLARFQEDLAGFVESRGIEGLESLPGIERSLAAAIAVNGRRTATLPLTTAKHMNRLGIAPCGWGSRSSIMTP